VYTELSGTFYRSVARDHLDKALSGSIRAGRYSRAEEPTLYLSSSPGGVEAAMQAHRTGDDGDRLMLAIAVTADRIVDLRDLAACAAIGLDRDHAFAPWQEVVKAGGEAPSWMVADQLRAMGANGLIDPSRTAPGLWHLVLFRWNQTNGPRVSLT
jgi:RES domain-containing protein